MPFFSLTPGMAGCLVLGHTCLTKMMQTILWRGPGSAAAGMGADNWMQVKDKLEKIPRYRIMSAAQLNEAEYAGPLAAALLFLASAKVEAPIAATLAIAGQVCYYWPRWIFANESNYHNGVRVPGHIRPLVGWCPESQRRAPFRCPMWDTRPPLRPHVERGVNSPTQCPSDIDGSIEPGARSSHSTSLAPSCATPH